MPKSRAQIQRDSNARRGIKPKSFNLSVEFIAEFEAVARQQGLANNALLVAALAAYREKHGV